MVAGEPGGAGLGQEVRVVGVVRRAEPGVIAGVEQHRLPADIQGGQGAHADASLLRAGDSDDRCRELGGAGQRNGSQVRAAGKR
jgi:hypothetical protein